MPQLDRGVVKQRAKRLRDKGQVVLDAFLNARQGESHNVLMETNGLGRTEQFTPVLMENVLPGSLVNTVIVGQKGGKLIGAHAA